MLLVRGLFGRFELALALAKSLVELRLNLFHVPRLLNEVGLCFLNLPGPFQVPVLLLASEHLKPLFELIFGVIQGVDPVLVLAEGRVG